MKRKGSALLVLLIASLSQAFSCHDDQAIYVYSSRNEALIKPVFELYTEETGIPIRFITDSEGPLIERIRAEGNRTRADLLITVDAGNLWYAAEQGLLKEIESETLQANIPEHLRDPQNRWFGLSIRARTIVYSSERVDPAELSSYAALADEKWKGRLCLRSSRKVYNQSLVAMLIHYYGIENTETIVGGWVNNLATQEFADDSSLIEAIAAGQCDVGIVNTYYLGRLQQRNPEIPVHIFWPDQDFATTRSDFRSITGNNTEARSGVHINVSGAGIPMHSSKPEQALQLLEWLSEDRAQQTFARLNMEYPVNPDVNASEEVQSWGDFQAAQMNLAEAGKLQSEAVRLMDRVNYR